MSVTSVLTVPKNGAIYKDLPGASFNNYQLPPSILIQHTLRLGQGNLSDTGALVINTGEFSGRSPDDKFIVKDNITTITVNWNNFNIPIEPQFLLS